jgi:hypothetical protein
MTAWKWYSKAEMLAEAKKQGFTASEDLIKDWIHKGLLGEAGYRERPGRGSGSIARWSKPQLSLFLTLLEHRQRERGKVSLGMLCNVPVWKWLYWGELSDVSLKQVQRAMHTWVAFRKTISEEKIRKDATKLAQQIGHSHATGKRPLIDELTAIAALQQPVDKETLTYYLEPVVIRNTSEEAQQAGKEEIEYLSTMIPTRLEALSTYESLERLPDTIWNWARIIQIITIIQVLGNSPEFIEELRTYYGYYAERITVNSLCSSACHYLLTLLGIAYQGQFNTNSVGYAPFLDPHIWQQGKAAATTATRLLESPIILPDGHSILYLRNDLVVNFHGEEQRFSLDLPFI